MFQRFSSSRRSVRPVAVLAGALLSAVILGPYPASGAKPPSSPSQVGQWSAVYPWPDVAIHLHQLPDGKVLSYSDDDHTDYLTQGTRLEGRTRAFIVDIPTGGAPTGWTEIPNTRTNLFCSGHSFLPDGRLLVMGGHKGTDGTGDNETNILQFNNQWLWMNGPDMNAGRWYPTAVSLPNGDVLTVSGSITSGVVNDLPEVWDFALGLWRPLTSARLSLPLYPFLHVAPNGQVFVSGPDATTRYLNTQGGGSWSTVATRLGGFRDYGSGVMYRPGKVFTVGGGDPPKKSAEVIDLNAASPAWRSVQSMRYARRQLNATLLADGTVLVTGGTRGSGFNNADGAVLAAELWNPVTERWTTMASMQVARLYHSTTALLPDGRVLSAGGGRPKATNGGTDNENAEIFSPPYLLVGPRPTIASAPVSVGLGQSFFVGTPDNSSISRVTLVRLSTTTHALNMGQRFNELSFSAVSGGLQVTAPAQASQCPPGHYLLFLLNGNGVPSVARIVQITAGPAQQVQAGGPASKTQAREPGAAHLVVATLSAPRPNPATGPTWVELTLPREQKVWARVVDVAGREVRALAEGAVFAAGVHSLTWDGRDARGARVPNGLYFVTVRAGDRTLLRRVAVLR